MKRLYVLAEGQTEETFVRELLVPHYARLGLFITPIVVITSAGHKGGLVSYGKVKPQIARLCRQDRTACVSTMFDLYALPSDFPGKDSADYPLRQSGARQAVFLEDALSRDVNEANFIPNLMVHEFEALLFVQPERFGVWVDDIDVVDSLAKIAGQRPSPEDINDDPSTAPSKRILALMPGYEKPFHGPLIACDIGLDAMRRTCPHFCAWLDKLEQLLC